MISKLREIETGIEWHKVCYILKSAHGRIFLVALSSFIFLLDFLLGGWESGLPERSAVCLLP